MKRKKVEVAVKTGSGVELTIKGDREIVRDMVAELHRREEQRARFREDFMKRRESFLKNTGEKLESRKNIGRAKYSKKTKKDIIIDLMKNEFFNEPKMLGDIQKAMAENGYHYPSTSLSPLLIRLVRQGILIRSRKEKGWFYTQRRR